jgi:NADP-dependent 3-hydroxy acid dehydrogenase YdfG
VILAARTRERLDVIASEINAAATGGGHAFAVECDVVSLVACQKAVADGEAHFAGRHVDIVVPNAVSAFGCARTHAHSLVPPGRHVNVCDGKSARRGLAKDGEPCVP